MHYERLIIQSDDSGWVRFLRADGFQGGHSQGTLQIQHGFTLDDILEAATATGWVIERGGERRIQHDIGCDRLAQIVHQMVTYFDRPDVPSRELLKIKSLIDSSFNSEAELSIPLWAYAWFDLTLREDAADAARSADKLCERDSLTIDVSALRQHRLAELCRRYENSRCQPDRQRVAASARHRESRSVRGRIVG